MGVDYSTTIGYGFVFSEDDLPPALKALWEEDEYLGEEHIDPWLSQHGLDRITSATVGDFMNGETSVLLCLQKTYRRFGVYDADGVHKMGQPALTTLDQSQLFELRRLLGTSDYPQWIVSFNVS